MFSPTTLRRTLLLYVPRSMNPVHTWYDLLQLLPENDVCEVALSKRSKERIKK
jgi:hypothetical protein